MIVIDDFVIFIVIVRQNQSTKLPINQKILVLSWNPQQNICKKKLDVLRELTNFMKTSENLMYS